MADKVDNKFDISTTWGDSDHASGLLGADNDPDFASDSAGVNNPGVDNKFQAGGRIGDTPPFGPSPGQPNDATADGAGLPAGPSNKTDMDMALEPNKFPRETGHDSLSGDEVIYT